MKKAVLDCAELSASRERAHDHLENELGLPDYYGRNLDALYDCLSSEVGELEIALKKAELLEESRYAKKIAETICQAASVTGGRITMEYADKTEDFQK